MFTRLGVPYRTIVEPQEVDAYVKAGEPEANILILPFRDRGLVVTRNHIWDLARAEGHRYFWTFDDNIDGLFRLNHNLKTPVVDGTPLAVIEAFADRYENLPVSGMNYFMFASRKAKGIPPIYLNNRVYSNMLIETDFRDPRGNPYRNEGWFNDDTDLCLRILKDGNCTVLFNAFLILKSTTMTVKGGMGYEAVSKGRQAPKEGATAEVREKDHRWQMAEELRQKHPDVTTVGWRFGHWQHQVDYSGFRPTATGRNRLRLRPGVILPEGTDNFGMVLERLDPATGAWLTTDKPWYPWEDGQ
jgi:hypothetical protein